VDGGGYRVTRLAPGRPSPAAPVKGDAADEASGPGVRWGATRRSRGGRGWVWAAVAVLPVSFLAVFFVWPVAALVARGFFDQHGFSLVGVSEVLVAPRTWRIVGQTLAQAGVATVIAVVLGIPGAYLLYRCRFPGRRLLRALVAVPFVLPSVVVGVAFRSMLAENGPLGWLGLNESFIAVVAALVFFNYSVVVRTVGGLWARLDRRTAEAARSLGASRLRVWLTVTMPALAPAIASAAALTFMFCASAFGVVLVLGGAAWGTIETEIWYQTTQLLDLPAAAALSILQLLVVGGSLIAADATRARQERALRLAGAPVEHHLRPGDLPALLLTAGVVLGLLVAPMVTLVWRSVQTATGVGLGNYNLLLMESDSGNPSVLVATGNSVGTALVATAIALTLGVMVSYLLSRRPATLVGRRVLRLADAAFMLPLGVSAVTVGFGFLITLNRPPLDLRSSWILIPIAQAIVALPLVVRSLLPTLRAIDPRMHEAAATLGATPGRLLASIDVPLSWRGFGLAIGFAFATSLGEFGATSFLARPDRPTLPVEIFRLISRPGVENLGMAMAASVVLAALTATVMAAAEWLGPKEARPW
jgi:thiamine transport system permease protein